jgi:hypothetical protein
VRYRCRECGEVLLLSDGIVEAGLDQLACPRFGRAAKLDPVEDPEDRAGKPGLPSGEEGRR